MIRIANCDDVEKILELYKEQFRFMESLQPMFFKDGEQNREFVLNIINDDNSDVFVYEAQNQIQGFVLAQEKQTPSFSFFVKHKYAYIMDIIVSLTNRNTGIGKLLIDAVRGWASDRQLEYIELDVLSNNADAISFYHKLGFQDKRKTMFFQINK